jgi:hypothetical protein
LTKTILDYFLPAKADNTIRGTRLPFYFFLQITMVGIVRSFIHIFSPDGGAGSIAGMDLSMAGADSFFLHLDYGVVHNSSMP